MSTEMTDEKINPKIARRADAKAIRNALPEVFRAEASERICRKIQTLSSFRLCDTVLLYASFGTEVCLDALAAEALRMGKRVGFPVWNADGEMEFYAVESLDALCETDGKFGIRCPHASEETRIVPDHQTMILLPGLLFDLRGHRIGYGGGMYDRYIRRYPALLHSSLTVGVTYSALLSDEPIPYTDFDVSAAILVTEKGLTFARKVEKAPKWEVRPRRPIPLLDKDGNPVQKNERAYYNANYVPNTPPKYSAPAAGEKE